MSPEKTYACSQLLLYLRPVQPYFSRYTTPFSLDYIPALFVSAFLILLEPSRVDVTHACLVSLPLSLSLNPAAPTLLPTWSECTPFRLQRLSLDTSIYHAEPRIVHAGQCQGRVCKKVISHSLWAIRV